MRNPEVHTLGNGAEAALQDVLLARAAETAAAGVMAPQTKKAPLEGAFSFGDHQVLPQMESLFDGQYALTPYSSTGDRLPDIYGEVIEKDFWQSTETPLGRLATRATISTTTACWSVIKGRNPMGYVKIYGDYGLEPPRKQERDHGILAHKLAFVLKQQMLGYEPTVPDAKQLDHVCRNPACCNPNHLNPISDRKNKQLMAKAHKVENHLARGQIMLGPTGLDWLDRHIADCQTEDTSIIVSTRFGPYRIIKLDDEPIVIEGRREPCEVFDSLKPPAPNRYVDKSRAKKHKPIEGEEQLPGFD